MRCILPYCLAVTPQGVVIYAPPVEAFATGVTVYSIPRLFHPGDKINYPGVKISLE